MEEAGSLTVEFGSDDDLAHRPVGWASVHDEAKLDAVQMAVRGLGGNSCRTPDDEAGD